MNLYIILVKAAEQKKEKLLGLHPDAPYIIALIQVSMVKLLVSRDKKLHADFKETAKGNFCRNKITILNAFSAKARAHNFVISILR